MPTKSLCLSRRSIAGDGPYLDWSRLCVPPELAQTSFHLRLHLNGAVLFSMQNAQTRLTPEQEVRLLTRPSWVPTRAHSWQDLYVEIACENGAVLDACREESVYMRKEEPGLVLVQNGPTYVTLATGRSTVELSFSGGVLAGVTERVGPAE